MVCQNLTLTNYTYMNYLRLKNYRCFKDTGKIPIKPLTFLVGANSSGKSSFLKFFPLLKQSLPQKRRGLFLWNGDFVDFKDFQNTLRKVKVDNQNEEHCQTMEISFDLENVSIVRRMRTNKDTIDKIELTLTLSQEQEEHYDKLDKLIIKFPEQCISCLFIPKDDNVTIQIGSLTSESIKEKIKFNMTNGLLPRFTFAKGNRIGDESYACIEKMMVIAEKYQIRAQTSNRFLYYPLYATIAPNKERTKILIRKNWKVEISEEDLNTIFDLLYFYNLNNIIDTININMFRLAGNITYIGPLRETTERYYRFQNLAVDEIDPDGSNLAMYLYNLSTEDRDKLNEWISSIFEFKINVKSDGGHVELDIIEKGNLEQNLIDVGFGYTQILPILVGIWKILNKDTLLVNREKEQWEMVEHIIAIEQPELHLHPRMQAKLGILLVKVIKEAEKYQEKFRFIIETHSETLLNKIGELIALEKIRQEDVSVVLFNAEQEGMEKEVELAGYSENGFLTNWPINFFAEDVD